MANGLFWPIPITLSTDKATADGDQDRRRHRPDRSRRRLDPRHHEGDREVRDRQGPRVRHGVQDHRPGAPGVKMVMEQGDINLAGPIKVLSQGGFPEKYGDLFMTPAQTRALFESYGWSKVAAFQTRNPMHRSHEYLAKVAIETCDGVLIHSLLGNLKPGDIPADVRSEAIAHPDRKLLRQEDRDPGRLPARHALRRSARGAAACAVPPELRLLAPDRRPRPRRRRQLLRPLRRAPHLRRIPRARWRPRR
jgi:hypothetical protein